MDTMAIARVGLSLASNRLDRDLEVAAAAKTLDVQKEQGQQIVELIQAASLNVSTRGNLLDTRA